jgi:hypothetical protein
MQSADYRVASLDDGATADATIVGRRPASQPSLIRYRTDDDMPVMQID